MIRPVNGAKKKPKNCVRPNIFEYVTTTGKVNIKIKKSRMFTLEGGVHT
jgi:hypothetical protein